MNKCYLLAALVLALAPLRAPAQVSPWPVGSPSNLGLLRATNAWKASSVVDLANFNGVSLTATVSVEDPAATVWFKTQWADDRSGPWWDERVLSGATTANGRTTYDSSTRAITLPVTNGTDYVEWFGRIKRFFRICQLSDTATSTGKVEYIAVPESK